MHVALLRGVNLGSHGKVAMAELRRLLEGLGFGDVRTLLNSGNVVFDGGRKSGAALEALLEAECPKQLGLRTDFFVRTAKEWQVLLAANPFPDEAKDDPGHLLLLACKSAPAANDVKALRAAIKGRERVAAKGTQLYAVYPDGVGRSKLTTALIEKTLSTRVTARNWNTVLKLGELVKD